MTSNKGLWLVQIAGLTLFYLVAAYFAANGQTQHWTVYGAALLLAAHALELPLAWLRLRALNPQPLRLLVLTLLYGLLWWVPAQRGLFKVR